MKTSSKLFGSLLAANLIAVVVFSIKSSHVPSLRYSFQEPMPPAVQASDQAELEVPSPQTAPFETDHLNPQPQASNTMNHEVRLESTVSQPTESTLRHDEWQERYNQLVSNLGDPAKAFDQLLDELQMSYRVALQPLVKLIRDDAGVGKYDGLRELADSVESGAGTLLREIGVDATSIRRTLDTTLEVVHAEEQFAEIDGSPQYHLALLRLNQERLERVMKIHESIVGDASNAEAFIQAEVDPWYEQELFALQESQMTRGE